MSIPTCWWITCGSIIRGCTSSRPRQKVLTDFSAFRQELARPEFRYVVPDFRLNPALEQLRALLPQEKAKVEFLCNECCRFGCPDRRACYEAVSRKNLGEPGPEHRCTAPDAAQGYRFSRAMENPGFLSVGDIRDIRLPLGFFRSSSSRAAASAARWCWSFSCIT